MPLPTESDVLDALQPVIDPELGLSVVDLGLVYGVSISPEGAVHVTLTATTQGCPVTEMLAHGIFRAASALRGVTSVSTQLVWEPHWDPSRIAPEALKLIYSWVANETRVPGGPQPVTVKRPNTKPKLTKTPATARASS